MRSLRRVILAGRDLEQVRLQRPYIYTSMALDEITLEHSLQSRDAHGTTHRPVVHDNWWWIVTSDMHLYSKVSL